MLKLCVMLLVVFIVLVGLIVVLVFIYLFIVFVGILCIVVGVGVFVVLNMWWDVDIDWIMKWIINCLILFGCV